MILKKNFYLLILFFSFSSYSQSTIEEYYELENERLNKVKVIEVEVAGFISNRINHFNLNSNDTNEIIEHLIEEGATQTEISEAILELKKNKLRELFFLRNKDLVYYYTSIELPENLAVTCVNGDFENGVVNYTLGSRVGNANGCATPAAINPIGVTINDYLSNVSIINSGVTGFLQFDPTLNSANYGNIQVPTISPNGSQNCIKLNGNNSTVNVNISNVTSMSRNLVIGPTDDFVEYEFSLILNDPNDASHQLTQRPSFRIELIVNGNVVNSKCYLSQPNCIYNVANFNNFVTNRIFYTGWRCDRIDVSNYRNQNATLRFTINDCTFAGHFGTVYIDNICNYTCPAPIQGSLQINPLYNCNTFGSQYQVCGNFTPPVNSTLNNLALTYSLNSSGFLSVPGATVTITGNNYCFNFPSSFFGANPNGNTYQFQVTANYTETCPIGSFPMTNSTFASITFNNCCPADLTLGGVTGVQTYERRDWIKFNGFVNNGAFIRSHAGDFIEMNPGFETRNNVRYVAYIQGCSGNYEYKIGNDYKDETVFEEDSTNLINNKVNIYPNPTSGLLNISLPSSKIKKVTLSSIEGKVYVFEQFNNSENVVLNLSNYSSGIYLINIETDQGEIINSKVIKN